MTNPLVIRRAEFDGQTRADGWVRCKGNCELCGMAILPERPEFHHIIEATLKPDNRLENMWVVHARCHRLITKARAQPLAKVRRIGKKRIGITARKGPKIKSRGFRQHESNTKQLREL